MSDDEEVGRENHQTKSLVEFQEDVKKFQMIFTSVGFEKRDENLKRRCRSRMQPGATFWFVKVRDGLSTL